MKTTITTLLGFFVASSVFAGPAGGPLECFQKASLELDKLAAVRLCSKTTNSVEPLKCLNEAKTILPLWEAIGLCAASDNARETLRCYRGAAPELDGISLATIRLCGKASN